MMAALLLASLVRSFGLVVAAWLLLKLLRVRHPASQHAVWAAVLGGMLVLPVVSVVAPHWEWRVLPRADGGGPEWPAVTGISRPEPVVTMPMPSVGAAPSAQKAPAWGRQRMLLWLYGAGLLTMSAYRAAGWVLLRRIVSRSRRVRSARLRESADVVTPVAVGFWRAAVILPAGWRAWSPATRRAVLAHEFAHLRRGDLWVAALARLVRSVLWFHPLAWLVSRKVAELSEQACDAAALQRVADPAAYSRMLLSFAATAARSRYRVALPGLAFTGRSEMARRIDRVFELADGKLRLLSRPRVVLAAAGVPVLGFAAVVALAEQPVAFEVASVRIPPNARPQGIGGPFFCPFGCFSLGSYKVEGSRVDIGSMRLDQLIQRAYRIRSNQLVGPAWMRDAAFDIQAKLPAGSTKAQIPGMLQSLLAERFGLTVHREKREQPVYLLVVHRNGLKIPPAAENSGAPPESRTLTSPDGPVQMDDEQVVHGGPMGPMRTSPGRGGAVLYEFFQVDMRGLAEVLSQLADRPVMDLTKVSGKYRVNLELSEEELDSRVRARAAELGVQGPPRRPAAEPGVASEPSGASLSQAVEKLGLRLQKARAPVDVWVVDQLRKVPSGN